MKVGKGATKKERENQVVHAGTANVAEAAVRLYGAKKTAATAATAVAAVVKLDTTKCV